MELLFPFLKFIIKPSENSFYITAIFNPSLFYKIYWIKVVLPEPKKPHIRII